MEKRGRIGPDSLPRKESGFSVVEGTLRSEENGCTDCGVLKRMKWGERKIYERRREAVVEGEAGRRKRGGNIRRGV